MCVDGRGGWTLSQLNVDRCIADYSDYYLVFCLGVLVRDANEQDYVESTRLTAAMDELQIGTSLREWKRPNAMWNHVDGMAVFEWAQLIEMQPITDGLIEVTIEAKLNSQPDWLTVDGMAYCRITKVDDSVPLPRLWESSLIFSLREFLPKKWRRRNSWSTTKTGAG